MTCKSNILIFDFIRGSWTEWDQNVRARRRSCLQKITEEKKKALSEGKKRMSVGVNC